MNARRASVLAGKALVAGVILTFFGFPLLDGLPDGVDLAVTFVLSVAATFAPWGIRSPTAQRGRIALAAGIAIGGAAVAVASDYWFGTHATNDLGRQVVSVPWDLVIAAPFALVALLVVTTRVTAVTAIAASVAVAAVTAWSYYAVSSSDSSTAAIGYLYPWFLGVPLILASYATDGAVRGAVDWWAARHRHRAD